MGRVLLACAAVTCLLVLIATAPDTRPVASASPQVVHRPVVQDGPGLRALQAKYKTLSKQLSQLKPSQPYILVDTARNRLYVKHQGEVVLDAIASTGSGTILDKPGDDSSQWIFDTPRGEFLVQSKLTKPTWIKPDWAFVEEGLGVPKNAAERAEPGVLGDYALGFGKGYFIHGTLYTRLLGKNVTHGCIRLNDTDLKGVYTLARVGTPIMIFLIPLHAQIRLMNCAILLLIALTTPSWGKDLEAFPNLNLNDPHSVKEATRVLEEELKLAARPHTYVLIDLARNTIHIKGRGVELHHMPIVQWSVGSREKLTGIHRLVARPQVVRRKIEPGKGDEQEPISLTDMPADYDLSFASGLTINVVPLAEKGNLAQGIAFMGKAWWRRLKNWTSTIGTDQPSTSAAQLEITVSVDHAQSLAWSLVDGMAVLIRRSADH